MIIFNGNFSGSFVLDNFILIPNVASTYYKMMMSLVFINFTEKWLNFIILLFVSTINSIIIFSLVYFVSNCLKTAAKFHVYIFILKSVNSCFPKSHFCLC